MEENAQFQLKVVEKSGLHRDGTFLPPAIHPSYAKEPKYDMKTAMIEAEMVMGGTVADLLEKTGEPSRTSTVNHSHHALVLSTTWHVICVLRFRLLSQASNRSRWTFLSQIAAFSAPLPVWRLCSSTSSSSVVTSRATIWVAWVAALVWWQSDLCETCCRWASAICAQCR